MKRIASLLVCLLLFGIVPLLAQDIQISGKITDVEGNPVPGATVIVKGTTIGESADVDGTYTITAPSDAVLVISSIGMQTIEVEVAGQSIIDIVLEEEVIGLDEVVVVAYGTKTRQSLTGAVDVVDEEAFKQKPVASFDHMLQGRASGVHVLQASGNPGSPAIVRIRGISTLMASTDPLYVIDGVIVDAQAFSSLNPNDIDNISILKDASSASLYGSRASNGVILVSTKRGKSGKTKIEYNFMTGVEKLTPLQFELMDAKEKLDYEIEVGYRTLTDAADSLLYDSLSTNNYNWIDEITQVGKIQSHQLSFSGGNEKTTYYISGSYFKQDGIVKLSNFNRLTGRLNVSHKITDKLNIGVNLSAGYYERDLVRDRRNVQNPFMAAISYNFYEPPKLPDGSWNYTSQGFNVLEALETNPESYDQIRGIGNFYLDWEFFKNFTFSTKAGIDFRETSFYYYAKPSSILAEYVGDIMRNSVTRRYTPIFTNLLKYETNINEDHKINATIGFEAQMYQYQDWAVSGEQFPSDKLTTMESAADIVDGGGEIDNWGLVSYLGTISYTFRNRYSVDAAIRRDGSSRFGEDNKWGIFPSAGLSWNVDQESLFALPSLINKLKLRANIGLTGNMVYSETDWFEHLRLYGIESYNDEPAYIPFGPGNPELGWEKNLMTSVGIDYSVLNNRISGNIEYFNRKTKGLFQPVQLSRTSGFAARWENIGSLNTNGLEASINLRVIDYSDLKLDIGGSFTTIRTMVDELKTQEEYEDGFNIIREGEKAYSYYLVRYAGVNPANGDALYYDKNGNLTNVFSDGDRVRLPVTPFPKFYGSFNTSISYKGVSLSALFYYSYKNYIFSYLSYTLESDGDNIFANQARSQLDHWEKPGDITDVPLPKLGNDRAYETDRNLQDGSYLRLKDITLSYALPSKITERFGVSMFRVYVQATNLFTITNYTGFDPEIGYNSSETNATTPGSFDEVTYPATRAINFGVDISL